MDAPPNVEPREELRFQYRFKGFSFASLSSIHSLFSHLTLMWNLYDENAQLSIKLETREGQKS